MILRYCIDFLKAIRVGNLIAIFCGELFFFGYRYRDIDGLLTVFFPLLMVPLLVAAFGNLHNNLLDRDLDINCKKKKLNLIVENKSISWYINIILLTLSLFIALFYTINTDHLKLINHFTVTILSIVMMYYYNIKLKKKAIIGNIVIALLCVLSIVFPDIENGFENMLQSHFVLISIFILTLLREMSKDLEDEVCDKAYGYATLPIIYGIRNTQLIFHFIAFCYGIYLLIFHFSHLGLIIIPILILLFISMYYIEKEHFKYSSRLLKFNIMYGIFLLIMNFYSKQ